MISIRARLWYLARPLVWWWRGCGDWSATRVALTFAFAGRAPKVKPRAVAPFCKNCRTATPGCSLCECCGHCPDCCYCAYDAEPIGAPGAQGAG